MENSQGMSEFEHLRKKAEEIVNSMSPAQNALRSWINEADALKLIHEVEVHHIELELQNQELLLMTRERESALDKYVELFDFAPLGYFTLSKGLEIIDLNFCGAQMLGKERSRLKKNRFDTFVSKESKTVFLLFFEQLFLSGAKQTCEIVLSRADNSTIYVHITGISIAEEQHCLLTVNDITQFKQAEINLTHSERKFRELVENALIGIYTTTTSGEHLFANEAMCKILEYDTLEQLLVSDIKADYKNQGDRFKLISTLKMLNKIRNYEVEFITRNGKTIDVLINAYLSGDEITGMVMDITDRKRMETELREKMEELERFHSLTVDRELKMIDLKKEINELLLKSGQKAKYLIVE